MRTLLTVIALALLTVIAHAQPAPVAPQTTVLYGYVYRTNLTAAAGAIIITERTIPLASQPFVIGQAQRRDTANAMGFISMRVLRNSIVYISAADRAGYLGIPASPGAVRITIPDADSVMLVTDTSTVTIPSVYVLARPMLTLSDGITSGAISELTITGSSVGSVTFNGASAEITLNGGAVSPYGDSIRVADSLARSRRVFISRLSAAITLDSSVDGAGRIYYTVSLHADSVQAWLRDSSMTWMLGRIVQLPDSGVLHHGYMTPTGVRTLLAGYSLTGHSHAIADVSGLATALGDTISYRVRMTNVEGSLAVILDTIAAVRGRLASVVSDLNTHIGSADAHLPSQAGQAGKVLATNGTATAWQAEADPVYTAAAPTLRSKGDTLVDVRQTHLEMPNLTHILTADSNKTICVDGSGRLYLCWKGSGGAAVIDTSLFVGSNRNETVAGNKTFNGRTRFVIPQGDSAVSVATQGQIQLLTIMQRNTAPDVTMYFGGWKGPGARPSIWTNSGDSFVLSSPVHLTMQAGATLFMEGSSLNVGKTGGYPVYLSQTYQNGSTSTQSSFLISAGLGSNFFGNDNTSRYGSVLKLSGGNGSPYAFKTFKSNGGDVLVRGGDTGPQDSAKGGSVFIVGGKAQVGANSTDGNVILAHSDTAARGKVGVGTNAPTELLDVAGNIKATATVSAKTVTADSAVSKVVFRDSIQTGQWIELDSMRYAVIEYRQPTSNYQGRYKTGKIKFLIVSKKANNYTDTYHMMHLRSDSANGVRLMGGRWSATGQNGYNLGAEQGGSAVLSGGWRQDWTGYIMAFYDYGMQSSYAPELQTFAVVSSTATKSYHRLPFKSGNHCYVPTFEIEVTYTMPSTSASQMPAFFTNN